MTRRAIALLLAAAVLMSLHPPFIARAQDTPAVPMGFVAAGGADFAAMRASGATAVKIVADWSALEPEKGKFAWAPLDQAVTAASRAGLQVVLVLSYTPKWASLATGPELNDPAIYSRQPPKRVADWEAFVAAAVTKYRSQVKDWQVWTALSLPFFRGTAEDYLPMLRAARAKARAADPTSRIVLATPYGIDLVSIRRAVAEASAAFDAISLSPRGMAPDALLRPLATLGERVLAKAPKRLWIEWDPRSAGDRAGWPGQALKVMAIAKAFGVDRIFWAADSPAGIDAAVKTFTTHVGARPFSGYLVEQQVLVLVYGDAPGAAVAWAAAGDVPVELDGDGIKVFGSGGEARPGPDAGKAAVGIGAEPVVLAGLSAGVVADARARLQAKGLPVPAAAQDFAAATEVSAKLGGTNTEKGLYNMPYRSRRNGAVDVIEVAGSEAVRTNNSKDIVFVYFDVDDSFLYYVDGRSAVEVIVEVHGASAPQQLGFNLLYDSMTGYRFTPWQVVEARDGWVTYTFRLNDAGFANTWGWDFAINAGGNRKEDLTIRSVTVRKTTR